MVTAFQPGQTITVKWTEIIAHDGWFRIALSYNNRTDLMDPPYAINGAGNSTDAGIENPPVAPVLADGLFVHAAGSTPKPYSYDVTLPTTPCTKCTLQVIQIMLNHPNNQPDGYTYHHCADISIQAGADGGTMIMDAGGHDATTGGSSGAGGSSGSTSSSGAGASSGASGSSSGSGSSGVGGSSGAAGSSGAGGSSGAAASSGSSGSSATNDGGATAGNSTPANGSCNCNVVGQHTPAPMGIAGLGLAAFAALTRRRRCRSAQASLPKS
jgi:MYXO-CTERM domain-containing protein